MIEILNILYMQYILNILHDMQYLKAGYVNQVFTSSKFLKRNKSRDLFEISLLEASNRRQTATHIQYVWD